MKLEELERYTKEHPFEAIWRYDFTDDIYTISGLNYGEFNQEEYDVLKKHNIYKNFDSIREHLGISKDVEIVNKDNLKYIEFVCTGYPNNDYKTYNGVNFYRTSEGQKIDIPMRERHGAHFVKVPIWDFNNVPFIISGHEYYFEFNDVDKPLCTRYLETCFFEGVIERHEFLNYMDWNSKTRNLYYTHYQWNKTSEHEIHYLEIGKVGDEEQSYFEGVTEENGIFKEIIHHNSFIDALSYVLENYTYNDGILYSDVKFSYPEGTKLTADEKSKIDDMVEEQKTNKAYSGIKQVDENTVRNALSYTFSLLMDNEDYETLRDVVDNCYIETDEFISIMDRDYLKECFSDEEELETFLCEEMDFDRDECVNLGLLEEQSEEL